MSATINCKEFADYFAVPVQNKMKPAHIFEVEGQPHSIEECYLGDLEHIHHGRVGGAPCVPGGGLDCARPRLVQPALCSCWRRLLEARLEPGAGGDRGGGRKWHWEGGAGSEVPALSS